MIINFCKKYISLIFVILSLIIGTVVIANGVIKYSYSAVDDESSNIYIYFLSFAIMLCILGAGGIIGRSYPVVIALLRRENLNNVKNEVRDVIFSLCLLFLSFIILFFII